MKRWKRVLILGTLLGSTFTAGVYADDVLQRVDAYLRPDFNVVVDGKAVKLDGPTLIYQGTSYLPVKELGNMLGAIILWKNENKTIYINSRINPEQKKPDQDTVYEEFKLGSPYAQTVNYLGADYPLLVAYSSDNNSSSNSVPFYRLSDVRRMGIDTNGLKLAKEVFTGVEYVSESELKKRWRTKPVPSGSGKDPVMINGELNKDKLKVLQEYVRTSNNFRLTDVQFYTQPVIMDKLEGEGDRYQYLFYQTTYAKDYSFKHVFSATLRLSRSGIGDDISYTVNADYRTDLEEEYQRKVNKKAEEQKQLLEQNQQ